MRDKKIGKEDLGYTETLDMLVVALCYDFERREKAIAERSCKTRTEMEYRYINYRILDAAEEIVSERYARIFIDEIGNRVGYAYSMVDCMSELFYKARKRDIKLNIARHLHLLD